MPGRQAASRRRCGIGPVLWRWAFCLGMGWKISTTGHTEGHRENTKTGGAMRDRNYGRVIVGMVLCVTMILSGCSTNWIDEAEQIVSALLPAAANMVTLVALLQGKTVTAEDLA